MKLLVISHNPVSGFNAMGKTLAAFLEVFSPEEVCQLYIYPGYPRAGVCGSFYRITDKQILKSWCLLGAPGGPVPVEKIGQDSPGFHSREDAYLYGNPRNQRPLRRLIRDLLWRDFLWFGKRLKAWMEREKPDCIFAAGGDGCFLYSIALRLSREYGIPLVGYICDEYYFLPAQREPLRRLRQRLLRRKMETFLNHCSHLIVISRELKEAYAARFSVPVTVLMTGCSGKISHQPRNVPKVSHLTYLGNLTYGRWRSLAEIGKALEKINRDRGTEITLEIYSASVPEEAKICFQQMDTIRLRGFVQGTDQERVWDRAELLVHAEDFTSENRCLVRHSISTKIADSLASGIPLLAFGPGDLASMAYLQEQDCAFLATKKEMLEQMLLQALFDGEERRKKAENGLAAARRSHNRQKNSRCFYQLLDGIAGEAV